MHISFHSIAPSYFLFSPTSYWCINVKQFQSVWLPTAFYVNRNLEDSNNATVEINIEYHVQGQDCKELLVKEHSARPLLGVKFFLLFMYLECPRSEMRIRLLLESKDGRTRRGRENWRRQTFMKNFEMVRSKPKDSQILAVNWTELKPPGDVSKAYGKYAQLLILCFQ